MKTSNRHDRVTPSGWAALVALLLTIVAGLFLAFYPVYQGVSATGSSSGVVTSSSESGTLVTENGLWALVPLCIPIVLAALGLIAVARGRRAPVWVLGGVLLGFVVLSGFTIGLFYLPAAIALLLSAGLTDSSRKLPRQV